MTKEEVFKEFQLFRNEGTKKVLVKHGAREPFFGVKVQDLKKIISRNGLGKKRKMARC